MKKSRRSLGLRKPPNWVAGRMPDRPAWRCRTEAEKAEFTEFIISELALRFAKLGAWNADQMVSSLEGPHPTDRRQKPWHERALDPVELATVAVPIIREIFEDYWTQGRSAGRQYRGHDPSVEEIAAAYGAVSVTEVEQRLKRAKERRPHLK